jgi:hypothetical protein
MSTALQTHVFHAKFEKNIARKDAKLAKNTKSCK